MRFAAVFIALLLPLLADAPTAGASEEAATQAIGRLNYAGYRARRHCTAFLVAPQVAMTAAHCLEGLEPDQVHLLLGYDRGRWREHLRSRGFWRSPAGDDLAALCLTRPAAAAPLALGTRRAAEGAPLSILGYGLPGVHRMSRRDCQVRAVSGAGALRLDCPVTQGTSGGPVLTRTLSSVVAVMSATGQSDSLAVSLPPLAPAEICPQ